MFTDYLLFILGDLNMTLLMNTTVSSVSSIISNGTEVVIVSDNSTSNDSDDIPPTFLQTTGAQVISGVFVWFALFLTCHQVRKNSC